MHPPSLSHESIACATSMLCDYFKGSTFDERCVRITPTDADSEPFYFNVKGDGERITWRSVGWSLNVPMQEDEKVIEHPEDYSGPSEPCGDLTGAPVGAGEPARCPCTPCVAPDCLCGPMWQAPKPEPAEWANRWPFVSARPPGGWSDCGPDGETT
jgi:hypothetical protein